MVLNVSMGTCGLVELGHVVYHTIPSDTTNHEGSNLRPRRHLVREVASGAKGARQGEKHLKRDMVLNRVSFVACVSDVGIQKRLV